MKTKKEKASPPKPKTAKAQNKQKQVARMVARYNPYLAAILDPEHHPPTGIPDAYSRLTHKCKIIKQQDLTFVSGKVAGIVRPQIYNAIGVSSASSVICADKPYKELMTSAKVEQGKLLQDGINADGYAMLNGRGPSPLYTMRSSTISTSLGTSFIMNQTWESTTGSNPVHLDSVNLVGSIVQGLPMAPGGTLAVGFTVKGTATCGASNVKAYGRWADESTGSIITEVTSAFYADNNIGSTSVNIVAPANATHLIEYGFIPTASSGVVFSAVRAVVVTGTISTHKQLNYGDVGDADETAVLTAMGSTYRVSAQSLWLIYTGAQTSNGKIAVAHVQDREIIGTADSCNYDFIAKLPGAYSGPLNKGAYCFWKPTDIEDTQFKETDMEDLTQGHIVFCVVANDSAAQNVTARVCTHIEKPTRNQVFGPQPSIVMPQWQTEAQMELAYFPSAMENDLHIREIAAKLAGAAKTAGRWASGIGAGLALTPASAYAPLFGAVGTAATGFGSGLDDLLKVFPK